MKELINKLNRQNIPYLLVVFNILIQLILFASKINGDIMSPIHPFFGDSKEYVATTELWISSQNFVSTFGGGWRLPGYSFFMLLVYKTAALFNCNPLSLLRIVQLILSGFISYYSYKTILNFSKSTKVAFLGGLIICFYYPFYHFTLLISAESISLFLISILMWQISFIGVRKLKFANLFFIGLNIALLTYLKPNHILFSIPVGILLIVKKDFFTMNFFLAIKKPIILATVILMLLLPWVIFISTQNKMFIPLATTSGVDMVIGTGVAMNRDNPDKTSLTYKFEQKHNLIADTILLQNKDGFSSAQLNKSFQSDAIRIWKTRPWLTTKYAIIKIAHSFGLGLRGAKDFFSLILIASFIIVLTTNKKFRQENKVLTILVGILLLLLSLQTFVYFGDMRLRILLFDMPVIYFLSIYLYGIWKKRISNSTF